MLRLSGGVSWYPEGGLTPDELQKNADYAMYVVKKTTKSQIRVWSKATDLGKEKEEKEREEERAREKEEERAKEEEKEEERKRVEKEGGEGTEEEKESTVQT